MAELNKDPVRTQCPSCGTSVTTQINPKTGLITWISCIALCFVGCCCIPFFINALKDTEHKCPQCGFVIGTKRVI